MLERIWLNIEIIGYSRAISSLAHQPGITNSHIEFLHEERKRIQAKLTTLIKSQKTAKRIARFGRTIADV